MCVTTASVPLIQRTRPRLASWAVPPTACLWAPPPSCGDDWVGARRPPWLWCCHLPWVCLCPSDCWECPPLAHHPLLLEVTSPVPSTCPSCQQLRCSAVPTFPLSTPQPPDCSEGESLLPVLPMKESCVPAQRQDFLQVRRTTVPRRCPQPPPSLALFYPGDPEEWGCLAAPAWP